MDELLRLATYGERARHLQPDRPGRPSAERGAVID
jgi:hypothetical protein